MAKYIFCLDKLGQTLDGSDTSLFVEADVVYDQAEKKQKVILSSYDSQEEIEIPHDLFRWLVGQHILAEY